MWSQFEYKLKLDIAKNPRNGQIILLAIHSNVSLMYHFVNYSKGIQTNFL